MKTRSHSTLDTSIPRRMLWRRSGGRQPPSDPSDRSDEVVRHDRIDDADHGREDDASIDPEESLRRLGAGCVDLLLVRWPSRGCQWRRPWRPMAASSSAIWQDASVSASATRPLLSLAEPSMSTQPSPVRYESMPPPPSQRRFLAALHRCGMMLTAYSPLAKAAYIIIQRSSAIDEGMEDRKPDRVCAG